MKRADWQPMRNVNVLMPEDIIQALNEATRASGRTSCADMVRVILRDYLIEQPAKLTALRRETIVQAQLEAERKRRKLKRLPYKCIHITGTRLNGHMEMDR